ncbi:putative Asp/Glu racemase [Xylariomycetidae sp. FL2044]|nr:putative Asp/Glu racemase [Xylariomycetidae sp. FL2044]
MPPLKLGILVPSSNTALEPLTTQILSSAFSARELTVHFSRFPVTSISLSRSALAQFDVGGPILDAARLLADARCDVIGWSGTSAGWLGLGADEALCRAVAEVCGPEVPVTTSTLAMCRALDILSLSAAGEGEEGETGGKEKKEKGKKKRLGLVTPYLDDVQARIVEVLGEAGYEVVAERHLGVSENVAIAEIGEAELDRMFGEVVAEAEAGTSSTGTREEEGGRRGRGGLLAVSPFCTNLVAAQMAARWEEEWGVPVLDTVATVIWDMLRLKGVEKGRVKGWGRLFDL